MNPKLRSLTPLAALVLLAMAAGCSDDATTPATLTQEEADDVATQVAASLATENGGTLAVLPLVAEESTEALKAAPDPVEHETQIGGITYRYSVRFFNAAGDTMAGYDPLQTVRLQTELQAEGEVSTLRYQAQVRHRSRLEIHGVDAPADTLTFNGSSGDTCQSTFTALAAELQRHFRLESQASLQNVSYLKPVDAGELPQSGVMTWEMTASRYRDSARTQLEAHIRATITVRFLGGETAEVDVDGAWSYQFNLRTGEIVRI